MSRLVFAWVVFLAGAGSVRGGAVDTAIVVAMKLPEAKTYSWTSTVQDDGRFYVIDGKTQRDGYTLVNMPMVSAIQRKLGATRSETHTAIFKGDSHCVIDSPGGWKTPEELGASLEDLARSQTRGSRRRGGSGSGIGTVTLPPGSGIRYSNLQLNISHPHDEIGLIVGSHTSMRAESDGVSGDLSEEGAKLLLVHPGQNEIMPLRASGTFRLWIKEGALVKYEIQLTGTIAVGAGSNRREISLRQTSNTSITKINQTTFEVPEEAKRKLG
ncbi:MAG TPA: hypothetical protein VHO24_07260 [Opitutaceae bacterium]|nr:hypothetical protein [Opitutaceae bacterium]